MESERFLTIHYLDGSSQTYTFPKQTSDKYDAISRFKSAIGSDRILLEEDGILTIIPMSAVKRLDLSPLPVDGADGIIMGARLNSGF
jgi:hypothetical protein